jgi:predicted small secreted protein
MMKFMIMLLVAGALFTAVGCGNTADGVEEDAEKAVDAVKDATN